MNPTHLEHPDSPAYAACGPMFGTPENTGMTRDPAGVTCADCSRLSAGDDPTPILIATPDTVTSWVHRILTQWAGNADARIDGHRIEVQGADARGLWVKVWRTPTVGSEILIGRFLVGISVRRP